MEDTAIYQTLSKRYKRLVIKLDANLTDDQINRILIAIQLIRGVYNINTLDWEDWKAN